MKNKLLFLTKMSLNKKIKTKWFYIANLIFLILVVGLINIDTIIKTFGGDFNDTIELLVIDEIGQYETFKFNFESNTKYVEDYTSTQITKIDNSYDEIVKEITNEDNKILIVLSGSDVDYLQAKVVSKETLGTITTTLINAALTNVRSELVLKEYNVTSEMYQNISRNVIAETIVLSDEKKDSDMIVASMMQIIMLPFFMLIIFLVQMIGAEVNEEKTTKSMEIIISNVSPKTHFISKVISSNLFVIIQGFLLICYTALGLVIRYLSNNGNIIGNLSSEFSTLTGGINISSFTNSIGYILPILLIMVLLTFIVYSLLAGILASMTTNLEDFQQLQTPIVVISLIGYYLSMMTSMFEGSIFIKIMSYIPFISSLLAPVLFVLGEITIIDLLISIMLLVLTIYVLIKYGLRIYKAGILNYSGNNLWRKMFQAIRRN